MTAELVSVNPNKTIEEHAAELRSIVFRKLGEICDLINEGERASGLEVNFQLGRPFPRLLENGKLGPGPLQIQTVTIVKNL